MEWFWLTVGILILLVVTIMGIKEGFDRWMYYYGLTFFAFGTFLLRRWMRKRMEKHVAWMEEQQKQEQNKQASN